MLNKTTILTLALLSGMSAAWADSAKPAQSLSAAAIINQMVNEGHDLRGLKRDGGVYVATIRAPSGQLADLTVDPVSGGLLPRTAKLHGPAIPETNTTAIAAMVSAASEGHWNLSDMTWNGKAYVIEAKDDKGVTALISVNGRSGLVTEIDHRP